MHDSTSLLISPCADHIQLAFLTHTHTTIPLSYIVDDCAPIRFATSASNTRGRRRGAATSPEGGVEGELQDGKEEGRKKKEKEKKYGKGEGGDVQREHEVMDRGARSMSRGASSRQRVCKRRPGDGPQIISGERGKFGGERAALGGEGADGRGGRLGPGGQKSGPRFSLASGCGTGIRKERGREGERTNAGEEKRQSWRTAAGQRQRERVVPCGKRKQV